jgi:uncharacterized membrane protein YsdA (DUF1294 family)
MEKLYKYMIIINIISFIIYAIDKRLAIKKRTRVPEAILLFLSIIGGSLGSLIAMYLVHHKTKKWYFVLINLGLTILYSYIIIKRYI